MTADATSHVPAARSGPAALTELTRLTQVDLRLPDPADLPPGVLGAPLPTVPNTVATIPGGSVLWLGPDEWLVTTATETGPALVTRLRDALAGRVASVVDVSAQRVAYELAGPDARDLLASGVPVDLDPVAFPAGRCAQTLLAKAGVVVQCLDAGEPRFRLFVRSSYAAYATAWLADAAS